MNSKLVSILAGAFGLATFTADAADALSRQNVSWDTPGGELASMPVGNGDVAGNVWVETNGDVAFYLAKSDAWNEQDRLFKLGRVRISFEPPLSTNAFRQTLDLRRAEVVITAGQGADAATVRVWADANQPVLHVACASATPRACRARVELWRTETAPYQESKGGWSDGHLNRSGVKFNDYADDVMALAGGRVGWYHRDRESVYTVTLQHQQLGPFVEKFPDPLLNRNFGAVGFGSGLTNAGPLELQSAAPATSRTLDFVALTAQTSTPEIWRDKILALAANVAALDPAPARAAHEAWWDAFWNRSHIFVSGNSQAEIVTRGYTLQRFMIAASSRGAAPPKFNGGLFTVQLPGTPDPDYRKWGGNYWFQNNRWLNWPSLAGGDYDLMLPFFKMYRAALPLAEARTQLIFGHAGAFFPETMHFWGTYNNNDFGWTNRSALAASGYMKYHWESAIELSAMLLDYYDHTQDKAFAREILLPIASAVATFFDQHWPRDKNGKIRLDPTQSLETWQTAVNDMPSVAGLKAVLPRLLKVPGATKAQKAVWQKMLRDLPPLPLMKLKGKEVLAPAEIFTNKKNRENPELYPVFPFRLYGVGLPRLELAEATFDTRLNLQRGCWTQNGVDAALLGRADEARDHVIYNFSEDCRPQRFPAFWPPGADWTPDLDNGGTGMMTLQYMLLQEAGGKLRLAPAWPREWNCDFKLHASRNTTVEGRVENGKILDLKVNPESRRADIVLPEAK